jgi:hypothetical protein
MGTRNDSEAYMTDCNHVAKASLLVWMTGRANEVEAISRQTQIRGPYQRAGREFARHEHIAKDADALSGNYRLDRMQLLPETASTL